MKTKISLMLLLIQVLGFSSAHAESFDFFDQSVANDFEGADSLDGLISESEALVARGHYNRSIGVSVSKSSVITLDLLGERESFNVSNVTRKGDSRVAYTATSSSLSTLSVADHKGRVVGSLLQNGTLYKLRPAADGSTLIIQVSNETLIDHPEDYQEKVESQSKSPAAISQNDSADEFTVIVAYTSGFAAVAGDITAYMDLLELETNTAYQNSDVSTSVKIVHSYQTSYVDTGDFFDDLTYFGNEANPEAAELRTLRDSHNADLMIILTGNAGYSFCGVASGIGVSEDQAYALASETCAVGYYSFGHEIGHLFGARHIISQDSSSTPFSYGHGYCNVGTGEWRTVMAYNCPFNTGGPRIQHWSNPNVTIASEPTGTVALEHNARVLNERALEVANFRSEDDFLLLVLPAINAAGKNKKN